MRATGITDYLKSDGTLEHAQNMAAHSEDSGEAERCFRRETERHSGMNPNTIGA